MDMKETGYSMIFPLGVESRGENFTGRIWLHMMTKHTADCPVGNVTFEPGCRNSWHTHGGGQILLVTGGRGYYQEWDKPTRELHTGDVVEIPANVKHWHGAAKNSWLTHIFIGVRPDKGLVEWMEPVSDEDYTKLL